MMDIPFEFWMHEMKPIRDGGIEAESTNNDQSSPTRADPPYLKATRRELYLDNNFSTPIFSIR